MVKNGTRERLYRGQVQRFRCQDCKRQTLIANQPTNKMKFSEDVITCALDLFETRSLRDIQTAILTQFGIKVSHVAIAKWIQKFYKPKQHNGIPCYRCLFMEELKARTCKPSECNKLESLLGIYDLLRA